MVPLHPDVMVERVDSHAALRPAAGTRGGVHRVIAVLGSVDPGVLGSPRPQQAPWLVEWTPGTHVKSQWNDAVWSVGKGVAGRPGGVTPAAPQSLGAGCWHVRRHLPGRLCEGSGPTPPGRSCGPRCPGRSEAPSWLAQTAWALTSSAGECGTHLEW